LKKGDGTLGAMPGILHERAAREHFRYAEAAPSAELAPFVEHYWIVRWDLTGRPPYRQWVLPFPSVNVTFTGHAEPDRDARCRVAGVPKGRFSELLSGAGRVVGARFRPGGFRPFLSAPVASITGRFVPVPVVYGEAGRTLSEAVLAGSDEEAVAALDRFLRSFGAVRDADADLVARLVDRAADAATTRVDRLAVESGVGMRRLQRLFHDHVGVGPKWVIRRYRLHEAAARAAAGGELDWVGLATELGYSDQAHLTRDFTALIGDPPARYARRQ
jgi:AraC-like DNA-binding protein